MVTFPRDKSDDEPSRSYEATVKFAAGFEDTAIQPYVGLIYEREERSRANECGRVEIEWVAEQRTRRVRLGSIHGVSNLRR